MPWEERCCWLSSRGTSFNFKFIWVFLFLVSSNRSYYVTFYNTVLVILGNVKERSSSVLGKKRSILQICNCQGIRRSISIVPCGTKTRGSSFNFIWQENKVTQLLWKPTTMVSKSKSSWKLASQENTCSWRETFCIHLQAFPSEFFCIINVFWFPFIFYFIFVKVRIRNFCFPISSFW